jgi:ribonucleotide reductase alpha subunit
MFKGNVNKANPDMYKINGLKVFMTNICSEITLHTDETTIAKGGVRKILDYPS